MTSDKTVFRIRDPIHDLITFDLKNEWDSIAWTLIGSREFQRLRRVKQLGFSELVFPGATHTRFSHSLGAYFVARKILGIIRKKGDHFDDDRARVAAIAALLHDVGHGPFSHVFEGVHRSLGIQRSHEEWGRDIVAGDSEIQQLLEKIDNTLAKEVALLLSRKEPVDIYDAVVSSQFDADRLDYLQRDKYMTGTRTGGFDFEWLLDCLEAGKVNIGRDEIVEVDGLLLSHKGLAAAEGYLIARFHLYLQIYLHKTTRSAERMLAALLTRMARLSRDGKLEDTGVNDKHPHVRYFAEDNPKVDSYLRLDDTTIWSAVAMMAAADDPTVAYIANGLLDRRLYKCLDVGERARRVGADSLPRFKKLLQSLTNEIGTTILTDEVSLTAYGVHEYEDPEALKKVLIRRADGSGMSDDVATKSDIVRSIERQRLYRVYCKSEVELQQIEHLWAEVEK